MLQFLNCLHDHSVREDSDLFRYFSDKSSLHKHIFSKLVWLHCSFDFIPHKIIRILDFFDTTSSSTVNKKFTEIDTLQLLEDPKSYAIGVIERLFESLKNITSNESNDVYFFNKIEQLKPQYHEMVNLLISNLLV